MGLTTGEIETIDRYKATEQYTRATWGRVREVFAAAHDAYALSLDPRSDPILAWRIRTCNAWLECLETQMQLLDKLRSDVHSILAQ